MGSSRASASAAWALGALLGPPQQVAAQPGRWGFSAAIHQGAARPCRPPGPAGGSSAGCGARDASLQADAQWTPAWMSGGSRQSARGWRLRPPGALQVNEGPSPEFRPSACVPAAQRCPSLSGPRDPDPEHWDTQPRGRSHDHVLRAPGGQPGPESPRPKQLPDGVDTGAPSSQGPPLRAVGMPPAPDL